MLKLSNQKGSRSGLPQLSSPTWHFYSSQDIIFLKEDFYFQTSLSQDPSFHHMLLYKGGLGSKKQKSYRETQFQNIEGKGCGGRKGTL